MKKKLFLNKQTITRLNNAQQQMVKGGQTENHTVCDCESPATLTCDGSTIDWCSSPITWCECGGPGPSIFPNLCDWKIGPTYAYC